MAPHGHYCVPVVSGDKARGLINVFVKEGHLRRLDEEEFLTAMANSVAGILERHTAEAEKNRLRDQLMMHEKLAALGRVSANVAHEIRNPLTAIGGFARRLQKHVPEGSREKEYTDFIIAEVNSLENILKNVLTYSRAAVPDMEEIDLHAVIDDALVIFSESLEKQSVALRKAYGHIQKVRSNRDQVKEVIENLVTNALDAMPRGGILSLSSSRELVKGVPFVTVEIGDTGIGIPEADLEKIFEPFFTTKVSKKGIGLGLSIAKKIMDDQGGRIEVRSKVGEGSTFVLYFPASS
jgi:signal transduction histidine kinase